MYKTRVPRYLRFFLATAVLIGPAAPAAAADDATPGPAALPVSVPLEEFSPGFLGMYRKMMEIEDEIVRYSLKYGVDTSLSKAVCLYESGGNANLTSSAGAKGYFQVMPATFRLLRVPSNIEAGIKYLGQLVRQFGREDYALAAYNGGPRRVSRGGIMPLESLQYVLGVGSYRAVLRMYEPAVRAYATELALLTTGAGDDWWTLSQRLKVPVVQVRLHNPFLAARSLQPGRIVAYPREPRSDLFDGGGSELQYRARIGDNFLKLAFTLEVDADRLRETNGLWRLEPLLPDTVLTIPLGPPGKYTEYRVAAGDGLFEIAGRLSVDPWWIIRDNGLWDEQVRAGTTLRIRVPPPRPTYRTHMVRPGDNLTAIARRYSVTVSAIQAANSLGNRTIIRPGERLRIPLS
ncbi:MAG: hypothetical protein A3G76_11525 [Acidobacteria bacterium RIFCSPLOWO2_12_FULL_65_11]|nr:MAG: hypothetical protein A3G76_11525 [Acidobacteria bacterium RIFCSPLOWO2_12_FULL_65_11]